MITAALELVQLPHHSSLHKRLENGKKAADMVLQASSQVCRKGKVRMNAGGEIRISRCLGPTKQMINSEAYRTKGVRRQMDDSEKPAMLIHALSPTTKSPRLCSPSFSLLRCQQRCANCQIVADQSMLWEALREGEHACPQG